MMPGRIVFAGFLGLLCAVLAAFAGSTNHSTKLLPARTITLQKDGIALGAALAHIKEQTGITVADRRLTRNDPKLSLGLTKSTFWQALQAIAKSANARISPYQADGTIALMEGPYRSLPVEYQGPFQIAVKSLLLKRDLENDSHTCVVTLEVAWEPWFQPFYLEVGPATVVYSARDAKGKTAIPSRGQLSVAGKNAVEVEVRAPAPKRAVQRIDLLEGIFRVIGPSKMLTFAFADLKPIKKEPIRQEKEGVAVSLTRITAQSRRWTFDVLIENPPGGPRFESYQSWLDNNQIYLEKGTGKDREVFFSDPAEEETLGNVTATRAAIRYHFTPRNGSRTMPGKLGDWKLVYRTPGRIVEVPVPFTFKGLELP